MKTVSNQIETVPVLHDGKWQSFSPEHAEKRKTVTDAYNVKDGRITSLGKFEGEPVFVPYYWNLALEGLADSDNGVEFSFKFRNSDSDFTLWPELKQYLGRCRVIHLWEDSVGFVRCR